MTAKVCSKCTLKKNTEGFTKSKYNKSGFASWCKSCNSSYSKNRYKNIMADPILSAVRREKGRQDRYKHLYGINISVRDEMFIEQKGKCFICTKNMIKGKNCVVDHNHKTGKVRKLLCIRCNTLLCAIEDLNFRTKAINYLKICD